MKHGDKINVLSYDIEANPYYRPAEVAFDLGGECLQVRFLDERFCKNGRANQTVTVLKSLVKEAV
jgi:hypothetical protein